MKRTGCGAGCIFSVILHGWSTLLCFEMIYRGLGYLILFPMLRWFLSLLPGLVGEIYLGQDNILLVFRQPGAVLLLLSVLLLAGFYIYFEITALFLYAEKGWRRERYSVWGLWRETAVRTAGLLRPKRLAAFLLLPVMAFSVFSYLSGYLRIVRIPEFIMEFLETNRLVSVLFALGVVLSHLLLFLYIFGFPFLFFSDRSFADSWRESRRMLRGNKLCTAGALSGLFLLFELAMAALWAVGVFLIYSGVRFAYVEPLEARGQFQLFFQAFQGIWRIASGAMTSAFFCASIVSLYHARRAEPRPQGTPQRWTISRVIRRVGAMAAALTLLVLFSESELGGMVLYPVEPSTQIVAHRAGAAFGPENTVVSLLRSIEDGADMAEIDVQQLGDGTLVVMHDSNFRRTTGMDLNVWDADYEMVKRLDTGSSFSTFFAGEPVPTLDYFLTAAKGRISLMIELKSSGRERELVRETLELIKAHGMEDQCMIASMDMELLKQVKTLEPKMRTVFISVLLLSETYDLKDLDAYSVETTSLSLGLVVQAHLQGKQVYAWTANSEGTIKKILRCGADGLITDNTLLAAYYLGTVGENFLLEALADLLFPVKL